LVCTSTHAWWGGGCEKRKKGRGLCKDGISTFGHKGARHRGRGFPCQSLRNAKRVKGSVSKKWERSVVGVEGQGSEGVAVRTKVRIVNAFRIPVVDHIRRGKPWGIFSTLEIRKKKDGQVGYLRRCVKRDTAIRLVGEQG